MPCRGNVSGMFCDSGRRCETSVSEGERVEVFRDQAAAAVRTVFPAGIAAVFPSGKSLVDW